MGFVRPDTRGNEWAHRMVMHRGRLSSVSGAWVRLTEARMPVRRLTAQVLEALSECHIGSGPREAGTTPSRHENPRFNDLNGSAKRTFSSHLA